MRLLIRLITRTASPTSSPCAFARCPSAANWPRSLYTFLLIAPMRKRSATPNASSLSLFGPRLSLTPVTTNSSTCGESTSYNQLASVPSSRHRCRDPGMLRSTSMSAFAFVSTTCNPSRFPLGPSTPSEQLDTCSSTTKYLSTGVLLSGSGSSVTCKPQCALSHRRTPYFFRADRQLAWTAISRGRHAPMMPILRIVITVGRAGLFGLPYL